MAHRTVVSCKWLKEAISKSAKSDLRVLESTWVPKGKGLESYLESHIPSARFFDMWKGVQTIPTLSRPLPDLAGFEKQLEKEGVSDSSHVVLYDKGPIMFSARMWLQCREIGLENVSVLDGGFAHWTSQGFETESGQAPDIQEGKLTLNRKQRFIELDDMMKVLQQKGQIVDTREPQHFQGEAEEPSPYTEGALKTGGVDPPKSMIKGHFKHSQNIFFKNLRDSETSCFKSEAELQKLFADAGIDLKKDVVGTCYNGLTACMLPLAASVAGGNPDNFTVYIGSWTEFGQKGSEKEIETGPAQS